MRISAPRNHGGGRYKRRDALLTALEEEFPPTATWTKPRGGLFVWARLPEFIDTKDLLARALDRDVAFVPGGAAYLDGPAYTIVKSSPTNSLFLPMIVR